MAKCEYCGRKIGGFGGCPQADSSYYEKAKQFDLILPQPVCLNCAQLKIQQLEKMKKVEPSEDDKKAEELRLKLESIFISPMPVPPNMQDCGLITGYSILGTGPFTTLTSSFSDFFGEESKSYHGKIKDAEKFALDRIKLEALKINCTAIYMARVNIQEATSGHGMIMVSVFGSACKNK